MQMQGQRALSVSQQIAWDALNNPEVLKACIPGCDRVELSGDNQYTIGMAVKIGPVSAKFSGKISLLNIEAPHAYTLHFEGQGGPAGFGKGESNVRLEPQSAGCMLTYTVEAQMGGKIAQLGQRLIDGAANKMADDFFKRFDAHLVEANSTIEASNNGDDGTSAVTDTPPATAPAAASKSNSLPVLLGVVLAGIVIWLLVK